MIKRKQVPISFLQYPPNPENKNGLRQALHFFLYSLITYLSQTNRWGRNETINVLFFYSTITFTIGIVLARTFGWEYWATLFFLIHLSLGAGFFLGGAWYVRKSIEQNRDYRKNLNLLVRWFFWFVLRGFYIIVTLFTVGTVLYYGLYFNLIKLTLSIICLVIIVYFWAVQLYTYKKIEAENWEGVLAIFEMILWTGLIVLTGGPESSYLYLYFITIMPALRRGIPNSEVKDADPIITFLKSIFWISKKVPSFVTESNKPNFLEYLNKGWSQRISFSLVALVVFGIIMSILSSQVSGTAEIPIADEGSGFGKIVEVGVHTYLHTAGWLLLISIMAIYLELDLDTFRVSIAFMEKEIKRSWNEDSGNLGNLVNNLATIIESECYFRATGLLVASIPIPNKVEKRHYKVIGNQINDITTEIKSQPIAIKIDIEAALDNESIWMKAFSGDITASDEDTSIFHKFLYYADSKENEKDLLSLKSIIEEDNGQVDFFADALSIGIIGFSTLISEGGNRNITFAIFKSKWRGEFDSSSIKMYESLFVQVVGIFQKYDLIRKSKKAEVESGFIADLAMTLTHDFTKQVNSLATSLGELKNRDKNWWMAISPAQISNSEKGVSIESCGNRKNEKIAYSSF